MIQSRASSQLNSLPFQSNDRSTDPHTSKNHLLSSQSTSNTLNRSATEPKDSNNDDDIESNIIRRESDVWKYAIKNSDRQSATCTLCKAVIKTTNFSTTGLIKHLRQVHKINIETPVSTVEKPKFPQKLKNELHDLAVKAIVEDSRSFNDFRKPGMMKFLKKIVPGKHLTSHKEILN